MLLLLEVARSSLLSMFTVVVITVAFEGDVDNDGDLEACSFLHASVGSWISILGGGGYARFVCFSLSHCISSCTRARESLFSRSSLLATAKLDNASTG